MKVHELKTWPTYFRAVADGDKRFEIRKNDRDFRVGDFVELLEYDPVDGRFIVEEEGGIVNRLFFQICYMTDYAQQPGYVVFGLREVGK